MNPIGIVMLNMGGPRHTGEVQPYLERIFQDEEIIRLPAQRWLGSLIAGLRTPKVQRNYERIGGASPLFRWTDEQGRGMSKRLDELSPGTAPHRHYVAFRYAEPLATDALTRMADDGVRRAVAFSQYPQYSCTTTGSSLHELWRQASRLGLADRFDWSVIDRWGTHPAFVQAMAGRVRAGLAEFDAADRDDVVIVFSAHSLPLRFVNNADPYPYEVAATAHEVMRALGTGHRHVLSYHADVGPVSWLGPATADVLRALGQQGNRHVLVVAVAFTTDHIETLVEIDIELAEVAANAGVTRLRRAPAPNDDPAFVDALARIAAEHLTGGAPCGPQFPLRCAGCRDEDCRRIPGRP